MHRPLSQQDLLPDGPLRRVGSSLLLLNTIDSTNRLVLDEAHRLADGAIAVAEYQTAGRGRQGRHWHAPRGSSILLSALFLEQMSAPITRLGSLLAAVAACEAIEGTTDCAAGIRWPNDLVVGDRKLGGVLVETRKLPGEPAGQGVSVAVVVGIGLNCLQHPGHFQPELRATSLEIESDVAVDRAPVARALLARLDHRAGSLMTRQGAASLLAAWRTRCLDVGRPVRLRVANGLYEGTVCEITSDAALIVELKGGERRRFESATTTRVS